MQPDAVTMRLVSEQLENPDLPDREFTDSNGQVFRTRGRPAPGVRAILEMTRPDGEPYQAFTIYEPAAARVADYPADLPFVSDTVAIVSGTIGTVPHASRMVWWSELADASAFMQNVIDMSEAEGWTLNTVESPPFPFALTMRELSRGDMRRLLTAMELGEKRMVTLVQAKARDRE